MPWYYCVILAFLQATAFASEDGYLTEEMMLERAKDAAAQHAQKIDWLAEEERSKAVTHN